MYPLLVGYETHNYWKMNSKFKLCRIAIWLIIFGGHMNILFIIKVKVLTLIKWSYNSPQSCGLLNPKYLA